eukprot:TRINITY_DN8091_c0_g1_i1.p1 TRINITY_DN8091_c0_g1~~TRINITY_DN8091_c0_g1_i1.p1  ORF type:complete len:131 (+),score=31.11 TRINITY_DN8091_c0_g1_i1:388-780(+)
MLDDAMHQLHPAEESALIQSLKKIIANFQEQVQSREDAKQQLEVLLNDLKKDRNKIEEMSFELSKANAQIKSIDDATIQLRDQFTKISSYKHSRGSDRLKSFMFGLLLVMVFAIIVIGTRLPSRQGIYVT